MAGSRRSNCNRLKAFGVLVVVVLIVSFLLYFLWPAKVEKQEVKEENNQNGDNNQVTTIEKKELSLVHVEGLTKAQTTGNLLTIMGFLLVLLTLGGMAFHYKIMGAPRRMKKDMEREKILDRIHDLEQVLVDLGHMRKKRVVKRKKFSGKKKKGMKMKKVHDIEESIEEEEDEDE